jgi:two-component system chemotaxis sensor kinase CheA
MIDADLLAVFKAEVEDQIDDLCDRLERPPSRWKIDKLFHLSHNIKGAARVVGIDGIRDAAHALEDLFSAIRSGAIDAGATASLARTGAGLLEATFDAIETGDHPDLEDFRRRVSVAIGNPAGDRVADTPAAEPKDDDDQAEPEAKPAELGDRTSEQTLRVGVEKLDALMGLATEFVTEVFRAKRRSESGWKLAVNIANLLRNRPELRADPDVAAIASLGKNLRRDLLDAGERISRISEQLQDSVRVMRMVRIDGLKSSLNRSLREATRLYGNRARLEIRGAETEVDRAILALLRDPLTHLIRNTVAHGIEAPEERRAAGKDEVGKVVLDAHSAGSWVEITVVDDGRGIDPDRIRKHAVSTGIATADEITGLSDAEALELVTRPGFSTVESVNELAGRGVGLDVVRSNLAEIGGGVRIQSRIGEGTRVTLRVPLTRLTTKGIVVRLGRQLFASPVGDVERTLIIDRNDIRTVDGIDVVAVEGRNLPVSHLGVMLAIPAEAVDHPPALVLGTGERSRVVLVDEVLGERELIIRPLSWNLRGAFGLAGNSVIEGDQIVLVLDSHELVQTEKSFASSTELGDRQDDEATANRILVVDDSATTRTLEVNILRAAGYEVSSAVDGVEAYSMLGRETFDLAVVDVQMPEMDGLELTRKIRGTTALKHLPVVLVTALGDEADKRRGAEAGADAYIVKGDFDQDELLRVIARLI